MLRRGALSTLFLQDTPPHGHMDTGANNPIKFSFLSVNFCKPWSINYTEAIPRERSSVPNATRSIFYLFLISVFIFCHLTNRVFWNVSPWRLCHKYLIHPFPNQPRAQIPTLNLEKLSKRFNLDGKREFLAKWR